MYEDRIEAVLKLGAAKATILNREDVVTSATFRDLCKSNSCGAYGRNWTCPPHCGEIEELMEKVHSFEHVLWYQTIGEIEDSYDIEGMDEVSAKHTKLCQAVLTTVGPMIQGEQLHLGAGGCRLCERCGVLDDIPCRHPDRALISLEACGIDVYKTTAKTELKYINGQNTVTYFGGVFFND